MTGGYVEKSFAPAPADLEAIGAFTRRAFAPEELYVFSVVLCNNDVDRDHEKFTRRALEELGALFVGKTGIFDHSMKSGDQAARIYATAVVPVPGRKTADGEDLVTLQAKAYMVRTPGNAELITQIDGGIKKEVSVGCSVERCVCSICGEDINTCAHKKGEVYGGKVCCAELVNAQDAYEWSFVAVPAQPRAGVLKRCGGEDAGTLKTLVKRQVVMQVQRKTDLLRHGHHRIQRGGRILEHHTHITPAQIGHGGIVQSDQLFAADHDRTAYPCRIGQQPHQSLGDHGFARPGGTDQADPFAIGYAHAHIAHDGLRTNGDVQSANFNAHAASLSSGLVNGSMASRSASPNRCNAITVIVTTSPGHSTVSG